MEKTKTPRGFGIIEFKDRYGVDCNIQKSSLAFEDCIWFGCADANPRKCIHGLGWQPIEKDLNILYDTRMHLTRKQVLKLLPTLIKFVIRGEI